MATSLRSVAAALFLAIAIGAPAYASPTVLSQGGADPSTDAFDLGSPPGLAEGTTEEEMWPAATAEGWKQPCLVHWQRSFDDAMATARERNMPVMVAVNMDGEIASEHFAGVRYRSLETAEHMSHYACVIASVYRHTPRDYDDNGHRIPCPRFGTVTCGEHIQAERELYGKYFDGKRISPRHIVLDHEEKESLDVYFSWDVATVTNTFIKGIEGWPEPNPGPEPTLKNLVQSRDVARREFLEQQYTSGSREERRKVLMALLEPMALDQVEVLRAAIFGLDLELARLSRQALAKCTSEGALDLMAEVLKEPIEEEDREMLLAAISRLAKTSRRAKTLAALHSGLALDSRHMHVRESDALTGQYEAATRRAPSVNKRAEAAASRPKDPAALLDLAEAMLERALTTDGDFSDLFADDAQRNADASAGLGTDLGTNVGANLARLEAVRAVLEWRNGNFRGARKHAVTAVENGYLLVGEASTPPSSASAPAAADVTATPATQERVLRLFADARKSRIRRAYRDGQEWKPEWLSDLNGAYALLTATGNVDDTAAVEFYDFLRWIGATPRAGEVLEQAFTRFPDSTHLHGRMRSRLLRKGGPKALEQYYAERVSSLEPASTKGAHLTWFAGYASLIAAEHHRRRNHFDEALASYVHGIAHFESHIKGNPDGRDGTDHYIALALAGRARVLMEHAKLAQADEALVAALARRPSSASSQDGLGLTPIQTSKMLKAKWLEAGETQRAETLQAVVDALEPAPR